MLVNEYELEMRNINNIPIVGSPPIEYWNVGLRRTYGQNGLYMVFKANDVFVNTDVKMSDCRGEPD
jgi:hypothetical protein